VIAHLAAAALAASIPAQEPVRADPGALGALLACRAITEDRARLACLDRETAALASSRDGGEIIVIDRVEAEATRRSLFGLQLPAITGLFGADETERLDEIEGALERATLSREGRWIFRLEDGAVWRQVDSDSLSFTPRPGQAVRIRRAALGSYLLEIGGRRAIRVRRQ